MWHKDNYEILNSQNNEIKTKKYIIGVLNVQIILASIIIATSFIIKNSSENVYEYAKDSYIEFFESDTYMESTFSYNTFKKNLYEEIQDRYNRIITVFNNFSGKGSADIYPANVSTDKIGLDKNGITPVNGYISSSYGVRKNPFNSKEKEFHTGIDIAASKGSFIKSAFDGIVIAAGYSDIAGNYIRIKTDDEITTFYAHNQFNFMNVGDRVLAGQIIGTVGRTGYATGPHLHFEFIYNGIRYNPIYILNI